MKKELINRKLLAECIKAVSEGKNDKAKRLFAKNFHDTYVSNYKLMEAEEGADDEIISDEFTDDIINDFDDNSSSKYEEAQFAIDELEDKVDTYFDEDSEETKQKIDDLRNIIDELNASSDVMAESDEDCDCEEKEDEARVVIEDIKADFEAKLGELPEDVSDVFVELDKTFEDEDASDEISDEMSFEEESLDEGADDLELDDKDSEIDDYKEEDKKEDEDADSRVDDEKEEAKKERDDLESEKDDYKEEEKDDDEPFDDEEFKNILLDIRDSQKDLEDKFKSLNKEKVDEEWAKLKVERNGAKSEAEGVDKKSMNFSKVKKLDRKPEMGISSSDSEGKSAQAKIKGNIGREQKGLKSYEKISVNNKG
jgi:hypothetical protein